MSTATDAGSGVKSNPLNAAILAALKPLASLKLTVASFVASILLILVGTLAQVDSEIWRVMADYFKPWWISIPAEVIFPSTWFPDLEPKTAAMVLAGASFVTALVTAFFIWLNSEQGKNIGWMLTVALIGGAAAIVVAATGKLPFFGGATIGVVMLVNLFAAHAVRFKMRAKGTDFLIGSSVTLLGAAMLSVVVLLGHNLGDGIRGETLVEGKSLWTVCKTLLSIGSVVLAWNWFRAEKESDVNQFLRHSVGVVGVATGIASIWLWVTGDATYLGDAAMRIVWQLMQCLVGATVMIVGMYFLFRQRAGVVMLHLGVIVMMLGQWFVANYDVEEQILLSEGETKSFAQDIRGFELAVIDSDSGSGQDNVFAIPLMKVGKLSSFVRSKNIESEMLPFSIEIVDFMENSRVLRKPSTIDGVKGDAEQWLAESVKSVSGTGGSEVNIPSMYVRLKKGDQDLGVYLLSLDQLRMRTGQEVSFDAERIEVDGKSYDLQLRFARRYKPYSITLLDVEKDDYLGTSMARHFSSKFRFVDESEGVDREVQIWMNNPLRHGGETFYQQSYNDFAGREYSTIQIVQNQGWMIPYAACVMCGVAFVFHFGLVLVRFLNRSTTGQAMLYVGSGDVPGLVSLSMGAWRNRKQAGANQTQPAEQGSPQQSTTGLVGVLVPGVIVVLASYVLLYYAMQKPATRGEMNLNEFGTLPIAYQGRIKPFDTLARNSLKQLAGKETFRCRVTAGDLADPKVWKKVRTRITKKWPKVQNTALVEARGFGFQGLLQTITTATGEKPEKIEPELEKIASLRQPAIRWLIDTIATPSESADHKVLKITNPEVLESLKLKRRKGYLYSTREIMPSIQILEQETRVAKELRAQEKPLSVQQRQLLDLDRKLSYWLMIGVTFNPPDLPQLTGENDLERRQAAEQYVFQLRNHIERMKQLEPPLAIAPFGGELANPVVEQLMNVLELTPDDFTKWQAYSVAWPFQQLVVTDDKSLNPSFRLLNEIIVAYANGEGGVFNDKVKEYHELLVEKPPIELIAKPTLFGRVLSGLSRIGFNRCSTFYRFEQFFNQTSPYIMASWLYAFAFLLCAFGWLGWTRVMNRSAYSILWLLFVWHSVALIARIYISGRPPVTNLYSSAIFIGWGAVGLTLLGEYFFRNGVLSLVASVIGFATLQVAHYLAGDGDTFRVLVAVLDTQFWLATHVTSITFGYAATYVAGFLGMLYLVRGMLTPSLDSRTDKDISRMIYGVTCFAITFSFIGTVLGGLWADDSWGRFWGWDPKENGALLIVLWNALVLHARWDRIVQGRGLALLAIGGNIITTWSWFGVNELGVGFHSYGFSEGRLMYVGGFIASQIALVLIGCIPKKYWWSSFESGELEVENA
ncbi:MAG: cytochrome c biogenesis protein CcsA [Planctomycetales bacterium]|nr:cytochrome c biogenesis protein CcsA [Planctomycetales bacterium]